MLSDLKNRLDVIRLLSQFGVVIYTGNLQVDNEMMIDELQDLYRYGMIEKEIYLQARGILLMSDPKLNL